jgi:uncharacterized repeat protein (TIGR03806 family)
MTRYINFLFFVFFFSCSDDKNYTSIQESPVVVDLSEVPYSKLSDYKFFEGELKNQIPAFGVEPYQPASELFSDESSKKRFIWLPKNTAFTYASDFEIYDLPTGAAIVKTFYYPKVQPQNTQLIIETRVMIKKNEGWIFAEYIWNEDQTDAFLDMNGAYKLINFERENGQLTQVNYRIPSDTECMICHKSNDTPIPIGIKPQNLNHNLVYPNGQTKNQISHFKDLGWLSPNTPNPTLYAVNYKDENQTLALRVRSYLDINCAHCHRSDSHCDYRPIRLALNETENPINIGVCVVPDQIVDPTLTHIIVPGNALRSVLHYRITTNDDAHKMPLLGRHMIDNEGVQLIESYINSLNGNCN